MFGSYYKRHFGSNWGKFEYGLGTKMTLGYFKILLSLLMVYGYVGKFLIL